jgi:hypothetical protein
MDTRKRDATLGRVYGGDSGLIHIADGQRVRFGREVGSFVSVKMRREAVLSGQRNGEEAAQLNLCPGCYMVAIFNCAVELANKNHQSLVELGNSLSRAFAQLAKDPSVENIEHIGVLLDSYDKARSRALWAQVESAFTRGGWM